MIQEFPRFQSLSIGDQEEITTFVQQFAPYSDFNFTSMWAWNTADTIRLAWLHGNLAVQFSDYLTGMPFLSLLGRSQLHKSFSAMLAYARAHDLPHKFRLVPEEVAFSIANHGAWEAFEDHANHDYMLSTTTLTHYGGKKLRGKKNFVNRFLRTYGPDAQVRELDVAQPSVQAQIERVCRVWDAQCVQSEEDISTERSAIARLLQTAAQLRVYGVGVFLKDTLVGFSIDEIVGNEYGIIHFEKADKQIIGIFPFLKQQSARILLAQGCTTINCEQDLGIEGLAKAKASYGPVSFLKKYTIVPRT